MKNNQLMQAACVSDGKLSFRDDVPIPIPAENEVLIKVAVAGICATDLAIIKGYANFKGILGHEFVGSVVDAGSPVDSCWLGKRVVAEINQRCGSCEYCVRGLYTHCNNRKVIGIRGSNGAFAEYLVANENSLRLLPDSVPDEQAVFIEPLAAAYRVLEQIGELGHQKDILIIGAGKLGQLIARVLAQTENVVSVSVRHSNQRYLLEDISVRCINERQIKKMSYDVVIETSGHVSGFEQALDASRSLGKIILKSTYVPSSVDLSQIVIRELTLLGSRCGSFDSAIGAIEKSLINPACLVNKVYPLSEIAHAMSFAQGKGVMKVLLRPNM